MQIFDLFSIINPDKQQTNSMQGDIICFARCFRKQKMKWQGRAILLPGIPLWLIMLGSIVFITAFLMFIIVGTYSRRVNVSGEVTTWPRAVNIYSGVQGFVVRQFVHEGQLIKKGILFI